jgi:hypothetical protein
MQHSDKWVESLDGSTEIPRSLRNDYAAKNVRPKERADEVPSLPNSIELNIGSWSTLDQTSPSLVGVGLFFHTDSRDHGSLCVSSIAPGTSAFRCGIIEIGDKLFSLNDESVTGWNLVTLRSKLQGTPGTFVALELMRLDTKSKSRQTFRINLMRGSAHFIQYHDEHEAFGHASTERILAERRKLIELKNKEQKLYTAIDLRLQDESKAVEKARWERQKEQDTNNSLCEELAKLQELLLDKSRSGKDSATAAGGVGFIFQAVNGGS